VAGGWRRLHNEKLRKLNAPSSVIRVIKEDWMVGHVPRIGEMRNAYKILIGKPEGKRPFGKPRRRWEDNIMVDLKERGCKMWTGFIWPRIGTSGGLL
jgi:hypothetical protein